jgi:hypothetical protein
MIEEELFALEREAERRVREACDREIEWGGPGAARPPVPPGSTCGRIHGVRWIVPPPPSAVCHRAVVWRCAGPFRLVSRCMGWLRFASESLLDIGRCLKLPLRAGSDSQNTPNLAVY